MAIIKDGIKYACRSCIRGHRVKDCQHTERELIPVQKRGRQVSQCAHCRHLRVTRKSHVKCICAITKSPNPMNGCLCEILNSCSCTAAHLHDTIITEENNINISHTPTPPLPPTATTPTIPTTMSSDDIDLFIKSFFQDTDHNNTGSNTSSPVSIPTSHM
ncbi:copper fist DNA binding domain-containing protein [Circinella umbellata]|nr:copper fist DNA binding domain-containing protein [Circinella umbellata]